MSIRIQIANILNTPLFVNSFISIDLWSIVHFLSGFILLTLLIYYFKHSTTMHFLITFGVLVLWEAIEFVFYGIIHSPYFVGEKISNVVWDIVVGITGATLALFVNKK